MLAIVKIRPEPNYRRDAFEAGLRKVGYTVTHAGKASGSDDLLVQWNRKPVDEDEARLWEAAGGSVLVCENGYIGRDANGHQLYAISVGQHNGAGWFPVGSEDRFASLGIEVQPWRTSGDHLLVCAQRGIGSKLMASPSNWHVSAETRIKRSATRPVRVRLHPGNKPAAIPLESDLALAWACVIWSSASGVRALTLGVPVLYDAPHWIAADGARPLAYIHSPLRDDSRRKQALHKMAWGQWTIAEIQSGEPFARILAQLRSRACA